MNKLATKITAALAGDEQAIKDLTLDDGRQFNKETLEAMLAVETGNTIKAKSGRDIIDQLRK